MDLVTPRWFKPLRHHTYRFWKHQRVRWLDAALFYVGIKLPPPFKEKKEEGDLEGQSVSHMSSSLHPRWGLLLAAAHPTRKVVHAGSAGSCQQRSLSRRPQSPKSARGKSLGLRCLEHLERGWQPRGRTRTRRSNCCGSSRSSSRQVSGAEPGPPRCGSHTCVLLLPHSATRETKQALVRCVCRCHAATLPRCRTRDQRSIAFPTL